MEDVVELLQSILSELQEQSIQLSSIESSLAGVESQLDLIHNEVSTGVPDNAEQPFTGSVGWRLWSIQTLLEREIAAGVPDSGGEPFTGSVGWRPSMIEHLLEEVVLGLDRLAT